MRTHLDTLVTALDVKIDDEQGGIARLPGRPPRLSHSELLCLAVMQAMLGFHGEARWLRHARKHYRQAIGAGGLGELRLLRVAFTVLSGTAAVLGVHPRWDADLVGAG